ncbi:PDA1 (YER178W) [Zygosaccharomyces parabailii]|uniref:Pyruvate dehydrogenase E1 component subunit alpha n=1 Tax=Zygosaccharomyces bailii (strain CLIB 213 / ATCC 58445 / CBS 680 / BCRC 21525 / NBRC 1098 / NCYC 1416 / NRRL Y-2227) TaxID=1333698 RepID=A0A8J2X805_ZYGB2|nr:PDA1 (YER178W) [Zygosaccharomyces parabailii]CDF87377.1 BN860_05006g1_1 [Zygosaccharomyces bailii CLIB 213]CDH15557.1 probable Pyruvate dehydrogenase E1 component subunit alpha, mitochondrial [Zygosaccharomyces bailii ISA1307]SJM85013.1 probable Pyruvate dehydrogenase E1 component subunit alpha, mitochondrial [Zygosaccharomyces bailii]
MLSAIKRQPGLLRQASLFRSVRGLASTPKESDLIDVTLPENSFEGYNLDVPSLHYTTTKGTLLQMFKDMTTIRRMEMACDALYKAKKIWGFCHLCVGQEAIPVGIENAITKQDSVITSYRCHGFAHMRGSPVKDILAELMGRKSGVSFGKGGSMHIFSTGFYGGNGIVGAQVPLGTGLAFAHQYKNEDNCSFTLYGDGAANQGQVFESFNMAKLFNLPVIFCCENNRYGMGTAASRASASTEYYKRAGYIPGLKVNGMDILAVYQASKFAKDWCLSGNGPLVLEYETYRYGGHSISDPGTTYRTREEIQHMRSKNDPIAGLKMHMLQLGLATEEELKAYEKAARKYVDEQVELADASPAPGYEPELLFEDVYLKGTGIPRLRGRTVNETWDLEKLQYVPRY